MSKKKLANKKKQDKKVPIAPKTTSFHEQYQHDKLRDSIVEAIRIIKKDDEEAKKIEIKNDHLSQGLILILHLFFDVIMLLLGIAILSALVYTLMDAGEPSVLSVSICWLFWGVDTVLCLLVEFNREQASKKRLTKIIPWIVIITIGPVFLYAILTSRTLLFALSIALILVVLFVFCWTAKKSLDDETDRAFLVSYFSAITGIVALVVSVIALVLSLRS